MGNTESVLIFGDYIFYFGCGIALVIESATLLRVLRGSKHRFVIKILSMLVGYNLAYLARETVYINMVKTVYFSAKKLEILFCLDATALLLFNVSHWMFAFKYFSMSRQTPYKIAKQEVPTGIVRRDKITNWIFLSTNAIPPILFGVSECGRFTAGSNGHMKLSNYFHQTARISLVASYSAPITSGIYLFTALYTINKSVKSQENTQVNLKAMALHATSFGMFMVSILYFLFVYVMANYFNRMTGKVYFISAGIDMITSSLA